MSHKHILDLTLRLSQALDQNYDVVSMETVLSVITALEGATITKEQLEATRLAKYINQLRRRTKSDNLARRAKSLLKKWREMVGIQQTNESTTPLAGSTLGVTASSTSMLSTTSSSNIPVTDNAVSISSLTTVPQLRTHQSETHFQHQYRAQHHSSTKQQHQQQHQPCHSQPTSPLSYMDKSNQNEFLNSTMSNPASVSLPNKSGSSLAVRKKKRLDKLAYDQQQQQPAQQQPTSFANLLTGLSSSSNSFSSLRKSRDLKSSSSSTIAKPNMETFIIEHSSNSNSNSDLICMPSNTVSTFTSSKNVPPIVIDLQDTNSSMNSLVSKDVNNASLTFSPLTATTKPSTKKSKKDKKRKERDILHQNQPLHDCDDNNTTTNISYHHLQRPPDKLLMEEKSHSACPTISNISEILSLSNSSMSSVFPSTNATSKNIYGSGQNELTSSLSMSKSDLTFAGKFKQITSSTTSGGCDVINYNSDSMSGVNATSCQRSTSPSNRNKFTPFSGIGIATNSSDSTSSSHISQFNVVVDAIKTDASKYGKQNTEELPIKHDSNDKSLSNMSNKGNFSIDNVFAVSAPTSAITSQQQQLQSIDLTTIDLSSEQTIKQPKKRGRKKGSKGVDSVIAKETSLSSQMLISSLTTGGKKVKTTKELYAEMQNRKLHSASNIVGPGSVDMSTQSTSINWPLQQQQKTSTLQRVSSCSDLAESDSCTMTSEPSRDSANPIKMGKSEIQLDSNSNYSQFDTDLKVYDGQQKDGITPASLNSSEIALTTAIIKNQINQILKQLAPPPPVKDLELESLNDSIPCTCSIIEILPKTEHNNDNCDDEQVNHTHSDDFSTPFSSATTKNETIKDENKSNVNESTKNVLNVDTSIVKLQTNSVQLLPPKTLKKSIFDLDFDDDEDPLNSIIADIVGKNSKENDSDAINSAKVDDDSVTNVSNVIKSKDDLTSDDQQVLQSTLNVNITVHHSPPVALDIPIVFPTYDVKLDPNCKARQRFDIQTQKITKFHIDALHNCFIPNINGNWNHADHVVINDNTSLNNVNGNKEFIVDGYGVVPFYGTETNDHIKKDLSHVKFTKKNKSKSFCNKNEVFYSIPFMGVARVLQDSAKLSGLSKELMEPMKFNEDNETKGKNIVLKNEREDSININQVEKRTKELNAVFEVLYNKTTQPSNHNNNKVILTKISIDIKSSQMEEDESATVTTNDNTTPLLAIADVNNFEKTEIEPKIEIYGNKEEEVLEEEELENVDNCRRNSSSSNNSLKQSQNSINLKLKQQRCERQHQESLDLKKRKKLKRRKCTTQPRLKRLKIHLNGNIESVSLNHSDQNQHSYAKISDSEESDFRENYNDDDGEDNGYDEDEEDDENKCKEYEYNDDGGGGDYHHEVVTHDISDSSASGRKHIVLTIKKTPSKTNSPINFLSTVSPSASSCSPLKNINTNVNSLENNNCNQQLDNQNHLDLRNENIRRQVNEENTLLNCLKKRLEHTKQISSKKMKLRNKLFFPDELYPLIRKFPDQQQECIFNTSSCSSSTCTDNEEYNEPETDKEDMFSYQNSLQENNGALTTMPLSPVASRLADTNLEKSPNVGDNDGSVVDENIANVADDDESDNDSYLPEENNLMLLTFNNIYSKNFKKENNLINENGQHQREQKQENLYPDEDMLKQQLQNCDDYNNLYNNSNLNLIKYIDKKSSFVNNNNIINSCSNNCSQHNNNIISSSSRSCGNCNSLIAQNENDDEIENIVSNHIQPYKEYHTGVRAVDEDVNDAQGNNCARLQQFKEWHEVLQLRSYNDELLTVLPYVVLE